jgi:transposase
MLLVNPMMPLHLRPPEEGFMAISLPDARELSDEVLEALRLRALHGCQLGFTEVEIADLLGVCRETVSHWWSAYVDGGLDALLHDRTGRPLGSGRALSDQQAARIQQLLRSHQPEELNIAAPLWTRRAVGELIRQQFGIALAVRAALFLVFLDRLLRSTTGKVFLIGDRLRAHLTPEVAAWVRTHGERLEVFYLPRYAPELNADEYLNNDLKGKVNAAGLPHNKVEVRSRIQDFMRKLLHLPQQVMSYFQHPSVQYAANLNV